MPPGDSIPVLIIVSGPPCVGKTTLALRLAAAFSLPLMTKDMLKETLYDSLGWSDRAWSRRLGHAAMELLFLFAEAQLAAGESCIIEANFDPLLATPALLRLCRRHPCEPIQIQCRADPVVLSARFRERARSSERHPGHQDYTAEGEEFAASIPGRLGNLPIGGELIELDMTDLAAVDYEALYAQVKRAWIASSGE
jgi:predicted kinase